MFRLFSLALVTSLALAAGCDCIESNELTAYHRGRLLLDSEPVDAQGVIDLRESLGEDSKEQEIVVVGRIGGGKPVFEPDHSLFLIVDPSAAPAHHHHDDCGDDCPFCSKGADEETIAYVHCVDDAGQTLSVPADQLLGLKSGQTVVISGKAKLDDAGNLVIKATGIYVRG